MKKLILSVMALTSTLTFAHYAVFSMGQVVNASGNTTVENNVFPGKFVSVEFKNLGTKEIYIHHMRFNEPQESMILSTDDLKVGPGETVKENFSDVPVRIRSVDFYVEGETELIEVYGIIP